MSKSTNGPPEGMTYAGTGVVYEDMDPFKRRAQEAATQTDSNAAMYGLIAVPETRGESVFLFWDAVRQCFWGHVHEGLGTKNLVADDAAAIVGWTVYKAIAQDTLAMGLNDAATLGVRPVSVTMHLAVGDSAWFENEERSSALVDGWEDTCQLTGSVWAGGETPTLKGVIVPGASDLSCSVWGIIDPPSLRITGNIAVGDRILLLASSGINANGLTLARRIAADHPDGYSAKLPDGSTFGEALLKPTPLYGPLVQAIQVANAEIHYGINVTGHGWRKFMRLLTPMSYVIESLPEPHPVFRFMQEQGNIEVLEMYGNLNMGAGFALIVPEDSVSIVHAAAKHFGIASLDAGYLAASNKREVVIKPLGITFAGETLGVR